MFPKGESDSKKVRVEFSLEDMDMSGFQKGATYEQIKAYVIEHSGLKVSSLYISQIKRKCGLDVGQNYNLSKKEDAKVSTGKGSGDYGGSKVFWYDLRNSGVLVKRLTEPVEAAADCSIVGDRFFCYQENRTRF